MGTPGLEIVRFRKRYYSRYHRLDGYFEGLGAKIIASIPTDPKEYNKWLESMRAKYAARETSLERHVYTIRDGFQPDYSRFRIFETLPSEFPRLGNRAHYFYIINLDHEVLTMDYSIHWKLGNIPRQDELWLRAIVHSIYPNKDTISLDVCPEEHMTSPALEYPKPNREIKYNFRVVSARTHLVEARKVFVTFVMASTLIKYKDEITRFGMEWSPDSFPFRELAFALVSIASGQATFHSFPAQWCNPRTCEVSDCMLNHLPKSCGWLDKEWAGDSAPLLEFGSLSHRPGEPPGASPTETIYWLEDVLVSLALVVDGEAITKAVTWGIKQGRANFQVVVLSLLKAALAEVSFGDDEKPFVKVTNNIDLSPLRADYCLSTHPRMRPELKPGMKIQHQLGDLMNTICTGTRQRLRSLFPGLAALANFFEVAASRRATSKSAGILPPELYDMILDFVDYDTWKACLLVSTVFRSRCLRKYRLDDRVRIVAGPFVRLQKGFHKERVVSFDFENMQTGEILPMMHDPRCYHTEEYNWMPVIGRDRKALMLDNVIQFVPAGDVPVEADSDDECMKSSGT